MISVNLNAIQEWERVRRETEPHTRDVDPNPGAENPNPAELEDGSHGRPVRPTRRRRRNRDTSHDELDYENDAYEVDIGEEPTGYAPPDGVRAPVGPDQGRNVDVEA